MTRQLRILSFLTLFAASVSLPSCAIWHLGSYTVVPDYPELDDGQEIAIEGLQSPVEVSVREDGLPRIEAENEKDLFLVTGYLMAKDRMFQMDFLRHMARGRISEIVGDIPLGAKTSVETDMFNRFLGFERDAERLFTELDEREQRNMQAFADGVNAWIGTEQPSLEHRLLDVDVKQWRPQDSLVIFRLVMFGLTHNYTRETRRLAMACAAGFEAMERVWPSVIEFGPYFVPPAEVTSATYPVAPAVVAEMRTQLAGLCPKDLQQTDGVKAAGVSELYYPLRLWEGGVQASNNWAISGEKTASGMPLVANDPHLPHLNPPIVWGVEQVLPDNQTAGFTLIGTHRIFVGHNFHVAWGTTINNADMQDLYVEKTVDLKNGQTGYEYNGEQRPFEVREETFRIKDGDPVTRSARFTHRGPVVNDLDPFLKNRIPVTSLQTLPIENVGDSFALRDAGYARNVTEFIDSIQRFDTACISWVLGDAQGNIGYTSPCKVPIRPAHLGSFPVPGWTDAYEWAGYFAKASLPTFINPEQGWVATANNRPLPANKFPSAYNNDPSPPNRWSRIAERLGEAENLTMADMHNLHLDTRLVYHERMQSTFDETLCGHNWRTDAQSAASEALCAWNGHVSSDSVGASVYMYLTNALLDRALADDLPGGAEGELWHYVQSVPHFETNVQYIWYRPATDPVWNDVNTPGAETRADMFRAAFEDAVALLVERRGDDPDDWAWGETRPFVLKHFFGQKGGLLGSVFNGPTLHGAGAPDTVFKNQHMRSDRENMHPMAGPAVRFVADMSDLHNSRYALAGGASGWPDSPHYADLTEEWMAGKTRPLSPAPDAAPATRVRFVPKNEMR